MESLTGAGFTSIRQHWHGMSLFAVFAGSDAIVDRKLAAEGTYRGRPPWRAIFAELYEMLVPSSREFLAFSARKPTGG
jgi:hypothetical protein